MSASCAADSPDFPRDDPDLITKHSSQQEDGVRALGRPRRHSQGEGTLVRVKDEASEERTGPSSVTADVAMDR